MTTATEQPKWQQMRQRRHLIVSPSQLETKELCTRKWWLERVRRLPTPANKGQVFGTVLHAVNERYLNADDVGRDPETDEPVELYPEGWHIAQSAFDKEPDGEVTPDEQDMIQRLVSKAIDEGVLERLPNRKVEERIRRKIAEITGAQGAEPTTVEMMGVIDLAYPEEIQDHKTTKSMKWAKSPKKLRTTTQMLIYAKEWIERRRANGEPIPSQVTLRHNVFCKDPNDLRVRKVEATVTLQEIEAKWREVLEHVREMVLYRDTANAWSDLPDPPPQRQACNAYGGCPFRPICGGKETERQYEFRVDRAINRQYTSTVNNDRVQKGSDMNFATRLAQKKQAQQAAAGNGQGQAPPPPQINPQQQPQAQQPQQAAPQQPAPQPEPQAQQPQQPQQAQPQAAPQQPEPQAQPQQQAPGPPPWANPGCRACQGSGFNSQGNACRICDTHAQQAGKPTSGQYVVEAIGDGRFQWKANDGSVVGQSPTPSGGTPVQADQREQAPTPPPAEQPQQPEPPQQAPQEQPQQSQQQDPQQEQEPNAGAHTEPPAQQQPQGQQRGKGGRPKKSFILCVNCAPIRGIQRLGSGRGVVYLDELLETYGKHLAEQAGAASYYDVDVFRRREALAKEGANIAAELGTDLVVCSGIGGGQSDLKALCDALRPHAGMVIVGEQM